jgi:hypothetical protein
MDVKLTLKLDRNVIKKAKEYANERRQSLSRLVEQYFLELTSSEDFKQKLSPSVRKLSGVLKDKNLDYKEEVSQYLSRKYLVK